MSAATCNNCTTPLPGEAAFCPQCGQSVKAITRPWHTAFWELITELFDFDGRMLVSLRMLVTRPGLLSYEYMIGRRKSFTSPIRLFLVISLVFFFVLPLILPDVSVTSATHVVSVDRYSQAMFLLLPVFALLLKLFYRQTFYLAHLVFALHLFSAMFIVFAGMLALENPSNTYAMAALLQILLTVAGAVYCVVALRVAYRQVWWVSVLKFLGLFMIFLPIIGGSIELASHVQLPWGGG